MSYEWLTESEEASRSPSVDGASFFHQLSGGHEKTAKVHPRVWLDTAAGAALGGVPVYMAARRHGKDNRNSLDRSNDAAVSALGGPTSGTERNRRFAELVGSHPVVSGLIGALIGGSAARYSAGKRIAPSIRVPDKKVLGGTASVDFSRPKTASLETWLEDQTREELAATSSRTDLIKLGWYLEGLSENELLSLDRTYVRADEREKVAFIGRVLGGLSRLAGSRFGAARSVGGWAAGKAATRSAANSAKLSPKVQALDSEIDRLRPLASAPGGDVAKGRLAHLTSKRQALVGEASTHAGNAEKMVNRATVAGKQAPDISGAWKPLMVPPARPPISAPTPAAGAPAAAVPPPTPATGATPKQAPKKLALTSTKTGDRFGPGKSKFKRRRSAPSPKFDVTPGASGPNGVTTPGTISIKGGGKGIIKKVQGGKEIPGVTGKVFKGGFTSPAKTLGGIVDRAKSKKWRTWAGKNPGTAIKHTASKLAGPAAYGTAGYMAANSMLSSGDREVTASVKEEATSALSKELARRAMTKKMVAPLAFLSGGFMLGRLFPRKAPQQDMQMY